MDKVWTGRYEKVKSLQELAAEGVLSRWKNNDVHNEQLKRALLEARTQAFVRHKREVNKSHDNRNWWYEFQQLKANERQQIALEHMPNSEDNVYESQLLGMRTPSETTALAGGLPTGFWEYVQRKLHVGYLYRPKSVSSAIRALSGKLNIGENSAELLLAELLKDYAQQDLRPNIFNGPPDKYELHNQSIRDTMWPIRLR